MSERNPLNVYNHFEAIKNAVAQLETIHVYELNARQYGDADTPSLKAEVADLDKKVLEYELQLAELQNYVIELNKTNQALLKANNTLLQINDSLNITSQRATEAVDDFCNRYNKLPRIVKKFYGVE